MTKSGKSVFIFGIYLLLTGILLCAMPATFVSIQKLPEIPNGWARVLGLVVMILGGYYVIGGWNSLLPFVKGTIYLRFFFVFGAIMLFVSGQMPLAILPLAVVDVLGAGWTMLALKAEAKTS